MPFHHPDRSHNLDTRIDMEVRERLEEAVDFVCLEALVQARRERGLPAPAADNAADRRDYLANVSAFLALLQRDLTTSAGIWAPPRRDRAASRRSSSPRKSRSPDCFQTTGSASTRSGRATSAARRQTAAAALPRPNPATQAARGADCSPVSSAAADRRHAASAQRFSTSSSARRQRP